MVSTIFRLDVLVTTPVVVRVVTIVISVVVAVVAVKKQKLVEVSSMVLVTVTGVNVQQPGQPQSTKTLTPGSKVSVS